MGIIKFISASNARPTHTGAEGRHGKGVDVDVVCRLIDGTVLHGEVTLLPAEDGRPVYERWGGSVEYWMSGALAAELYRIAEAEGVQAKQFVMDAIEARASRAAGIP